MRIVLACRVYPTSRKGGMPFVVQDRARALVKAGNEVVVLTTAKHAGPCEVDDAGVRVVHLQCSPDVYSDGYAIEAEKFCRAWSPEIVHSDSLDVNRRWWTNLKARTAVTLHGFCWGAHLTKWNQCRVLGQSWSLSADDVAGMMREREAINSFDRVIGISRHEHTMLRDQMGIFRAALVYNPVADCFFDADVLPGPAKPQFLTAAISGRSTRRFDWARRMARRAGYSSWSASGVDREQMPGVYAQATGLLLPTLYSQGADLTVSEALLSGRFALVAATGSYLRECEPGGLWDGLAECLPIDEEQAWVDAIRRVASQPPQSVAVVRSRLDVQRPAVHAAKFLEEVLK